MSSLKLIIEVEGQADLTRQFKGVTEDINDLTEGFKAARQIFLDSEKDNYQSINSTGKSGTWQPLSKRYEEQKARSMGFLAFVSIERLSDRTYKSLTGDTGDTINVIGKQEAVFGTTSPQARPQHFGVPSKNIPARPLIDLSDSQIKAMADAIRKTIVKSVKRKRTFIATEDNYRDFV